MVDTPEEPKKVEAIEVPPASPEEKMETISTVEQLADLAASQQQEIWQETADARTASTEQVDRALGSMEVSPDGQEVTNFKSDLGASEETLAAAQDVATAGIDAVAEGTDIIELGPALTLKREVDAEVMRQDIGQLELRQEEITARAKTLDELLGRQAVQELLRNSAREEWVGVGARDPKVSTMTPEDYFDKQYMPTLKELGSKGILEVINREVDRQIAFPLSALEGKLKRVQEDIAARQKAESVVERAPEAMVVDLDPGLKTQFADLYRAEQAAFPSSNVTDMISKVQMGDYFNSRTFRDETGEENTKESVHDDMAYIAEETAIKLEELEEEKRGGATVDDAYLEKLKLALPIFEKVLPQLDGLRTQRSGGRTWAIETIAHIERMIHFGKQKEEVESAWKRRKIFLERRRSSLFKHLRNVRRKAA